MTMEDERQSFTAALASALQENESKTASPSERMHDTYVKLCHDDPYDIDATGCELLAHELLKADTNDYALSNRFVQGLEQVLQRPIEYNHIDGTDNNPSYTNNLMDRAISYLAWTVHVRIPLACLNVCCSVRQNIKTRDEKLQMVQRWMGSYRGTVLATQDRNDNLLLEQLTQDMHISENSMDVTITNERKNGSHNNDDDDLSSDPGRITTTARQQQDEIDSMEEEEVWADQSDPDDFEFESGYNYQEELQALDTWAEQAVIDPHKLSMAPDDTTWLDIALGMVSLLTPVRYSPHLAALSDKDWKDAWESCWTPLILSLLVLPDQNVDCPLWQTDIAMKSEFQRLGFHLAQIVRDAASHRPNVLTRPYIELLQNLLQVQTAQNQSPTTGVLPVAWVGLGSFSALCDSAFGQGSKKYSPQTLRDIQNGIIESCEPLTLLLERSLGDSQTYCAVQWSYTSLLRALSVDPLSNVPTVESTHGQLMLQSGLFRQWILHWLKERNWENSEVVHVHRHVCQTLWELCVASPTLLGKYAWRFPDLAAAVTNNKTGNGVDALLWNLLGIHLSKSDAPKLKLRNSVAVDPPSTAECQSAAWAAFQSCCHNVESILLRWRERIDHDGGGAGKESSSEETKKDVYDVKAFGRFVEILTQSQLACKLFLEEMVPIVDGKQPITILKACVEPLKDALRDWPSQNDADSSTVRDHSDDEKDVSPRRRRNVLPIQEVRNDMKTLSTIFLSHGEVARLSSKSD